MLSQQIVNLPIAEEQVVGVQQFQLLSVVPVVLLRAVVPDRLRHQGQVQVLDLGGEGALGIGGEDGEARVVLFGIDGDWELDLDGADGVVLGDFCHIDLDIDEALAASLEEILDVPRLVDELLETGDGLVDLRLVNFDEADGFLLAFELQFGALELVAIVGQVLLEGLRLLRQRHSFRRFLLFLLVFGLLSHRC